jgi:exodeoxyribonuclease-3
VKIVTWNVNSVRARLAAVLAWLDEVKPDVLLLQETKCLNEQFPAEPFEERHYNLALVGEGPRSGVAILAKHPIEDVLDHLPGDPDDHEARYVEATIGGLRVASVYVPNGTALGTDRFAYKLAFLARMRAHAARLLEQDECLVIGGDYNVAPRPIDVYDAKALDGTICYHPDERAALRGLLHLGLYDAYREYRPSGDEFSWWHYQGRAFQAGQGLRIDHLLLSAAAIDRLQAAGIDARPRHAKAASDHAPVWCLLGAEARFMEQNPGSQR